MAGSHRPDVQKDTWRSRAKYGRLSWKHSYPTSDFIHKYLRTPSSAPEEMLHSRSLKNSPTARSHIPQVAIESNTLNMPPNVVGSFLSLHGRVREVREPGTALDGAS